MVHSDEKKEDAEREPLLVVVEPSTEVKERYGDNSMNKFNHRKNLFKNEVLIELSDISENTKTIDELYESKRYDKVLELLQNNSKFPKDIDVETIHHEGLKKFIQHTTNIHLNLKINERDEILNHIVNIKQLYPNLRHIYSVNILNNEFNKSAARIALENENFDLYQLLSDYFITLAPDENIEEIIENLYGNKNFPNEIITKLSVDSKPYNDVFSMLLQRTYIISKEVYNEQIEAIKNAYNVINSVPKISKISSSLMKNKFIINFDFEKESFEQNELNENEIKIPAKNLRSSANEVYFDIVQKLFKFALKSLDKNETKTSRKYQDMIENVNIDSFKNIEIDKRPSFGWIELKYITEYNKRDKEILLNYTNELGHNWIMIAAARGWENEIEELIKVGFDVNSKVGENYAVDLAYNNQNFPTAFILLKNNSKLPKKISTETEFKDDNIEEFWNMTIEIHNKIKSGDRDLIIITEFRDKFKNVKHIYNFEGEAQLSALFLALKSKHRYAINILTINDFDILPSEYVEAKELVEEIEKVHKLSNTERNFADKTNIQLFYENSFIGYNISEEEREKRRRSVMTAFYKIDDNPDVKPILDYVMKHGNCRMIFDFENDHQSKKDIGKIQGHQQKYIYIGAIKHLNANFDLPGTIIKEIFPHLLVNFYENSGLPYFKKDNSNFEACKTQCKENEKKENMIRDAFDDKTGKCDDIKLISVVPCKLLQGEKNDLELNFRKLLKYYENIKSEVEEKMKNNDKNVDEQLNNSNNEEKKQESIKKERIVLVVKFLIAVLALGIFVLISIKFISNTNEPLYNFQVSPNCGKVSINYPGNTIRGKANTSYHGQWPWHAPLFYYPTEQKKKILNITNNFTYICGSTLLSSFYLLTAAHCVNDEDHTSFFVAFGGFNLKNIDSNDWIKRNLSAIYVHEKYIDQEERDRYKSSNDIAVLKMTVKVSFTVFIQPICLFQHEINTDGLHGFVVGYGLSDRSSPLHDNILRYAVQNTISNIKCIFLHEDYSKIVSENSFCSKHSTAALCRGDSGGGFYLKNEHNQYSLIGIVSQNLQTQICRNEDYAVIVDVPKYIKWIDKKTCGLKENCEKLNEVKNNTI